jgi:hypothetical protein
LDTMLNPNIEYETWDRFKMDMESQLGQGLPVDLWLRTKPKKPLPWDYNDFQTALSEVKRIQQSLMESPNRFRAHLYA